MTAGRGGAPRARGFTLVELTVALVAGLVVAYGIVSLSKEATRTFHEEVRSSAAEATLRTAVDRLRADLKRAAYMSTGNVVKDRRIAHAPGEVNNSRVDHTMAGIKSLAGIQLVDGGSLQNTPMSAWQSPALKPDAILIGGNMTSAEQFEVETIQLVGNCNRMVLSSTSPAMYRAIAGATTAANQALELNNLFQPYPGRQFIVRLVDDTGRSQFLATCPGATTAGFLTPTQPYVDVDAIATPLLSAQTTRTLGGVNQTPAGRAFVNPVQIVRWELVDTGHEAAPYRNVLGQLPLSAGADATKYDLVRSYVDALGKRVDETMEVIAEYAVDLDFAFSVDSGLPSQPAMQTFAFDAPDSADWAGDVLQLPNTNPQRIRTVRARVTTRAAQPDRTTALPIADNYGAQTPQGFLYRYCVAQPCNSDGALRWARARTITTEVALSNQATNYD
ncbi:MAG TPA: prepilin-type N-terminal cleavage/methylation domain-containing protein [Polyangiaceae bacterium]|nr:prepilin-type N-terminal cleavage/methylation domain-containing protein [Polyangiaceae bacterium]